MVAIWLEVGEEEEECGLVGRELMPFAISRRNGDRRGERGRRDNAARIFSRATIAILPKSEMLQRKEGVGWIKGGSPSLALLSSVYISAAFKHSIL